MPWVDADARVVAVLEHGGQVVMLALDDDRAVQLIDLHGGLVVRPGWERYGVVREEEGGHGVVDFDVHGRVFEEVGHPVEETVAGGVVIVWVTFVVDGSRKGEGRGGGEEGEEST